MQKTIVTAAGPSMLPVLTFSLPFFNTFADRHGYDVHVEYLAEDHADRWTDTAKRVRWRKLSFIRAALQNSDIIVWFDADVLLCRTDTDILDSLGANDYQGLALHSVPFENRTSPNTGVWVIRNTEKTWRFFDKVEGIGIPEGRWADQGAVLRALGWVLGNEHYHGARMPDTPTEFIQGTTWLPLEWNQPYCENRAEVEEFASRPKACDPFALHFSRMTIPDRLRCMREVVERNSNRKCA